MEPYRSIKPPKHSPRQYQERVRFATGVDLPKLIDKTGYYILRNGMIAIVSEIDAVQKSTFNCKGHILRTTPTGRIRQDFNIWQANGRFVALGEHPHDIVRKCMSPLFP